MGGDAKSKAAEDARVAYAEATKIAEKDLVVTHPIRLGLALNFSVFQYEVLQNPDEACKMARVAFEDAIAEGTTWLKTRTKIPLSPCSCCATTLRCGPLIRKVAISDPKLFLIWCLLRTAT